MLRKLDKYWIGCLVGLVLPAAFAWIYIDTYHLWGILRTFHFTGEVCTKLAILSCFPDLALLFLFYTTDTWRLSKGVLIGMFPYLLLAIWTTL